MPAAAAPSRRKRSDGFCGNSCGVLHNSQNGIAIYLVVWYINRNNMHISPELSAETVTSSGMGQNEHPQSAYRDGRRAPSFRPAGIAGTGVSTMA